ncbi:hypothetical protein [Lentzea sp.]|uniref:hypothetical protein n=1 Tax=Lentzea sp. TaxID=56099 RepID=UPI002ED62BFA
MVLNVPVGLGEPALLTAACEQWRLSGVRMIALSGAARPGDRGPFGIDPLLRVMRAHLEYFGIPGVIDAVGAITRLRDLHQDTEIPALLGVALRSLFQCITSSRQVVLLVDHTHEFQPHLLVDACGRAGALAVVTCGSDADMSFAANELFVLADEVIEISPPDTSLG